MSELQVPTIANKKEMKSDKYLYGINLQPYENLPYKQMLLTKIVLAKRQLHLLVRDHNMVDGKRIREVAKAVDFNKHLIMELGYSAPDVSNMIRNTTIEEA